MLAIFLGYFFRLSTTTFLIKFLIKSERTINDNKIIWLSLLFSAFPDGLIGLYFLGVVVILDEYLGQEHEVEGRPEVLLYLDVGVFHLH